MAHKAVGNLIEGRYLELLIHPEIQMQPAADIGWRVFQYNAGLLLQQANPNARVLTLVFYHCPGTGGVQERSHRLEFYGHSLQEVGYWSVGLGNLDADEYAGADNPMAWALASWMRQRRQGRAELRLRLLHKTLRSVHDGEYRRLLLDTLRTYFRLDRGEQVEEERLLQSGEYAEVGEMFQTELGKLEERARREGRREGRQEALTELGKLTDQAKQEALQDALIDVVQSRFATAAGSVTDQIRQLNDAARLKELIRRAATAASWEEIEPLLRQ